MISKIVVGFVFLIPVFLILGFIIWWFKERYKSSRNKNVQDNLLSDAGTYLMNKLKFEHKERNTKKDVNCYRVLVDGVYELRDGTKKKCKKGDIIEYPREWHKHKGVLVTRVQ